MEKQSIASNEYDENDDSKMGKQREINDFHDGFE